MLPARPQQLSQATTSANSSSVRTLNKARDIMPTYCAISDKQEIGAFYRTHHIDDGDGATTVTAENICE